MAEATQRVFVVRVHDVEEVKAFFTALGLTFVAEKHGDGPEHYACEHEGRVFEIYPRLPDKATSARFMP